MTSPATAWDIHAHGLPAALLEALSTSGDELGARIALRDGERVIEFVGGERTAPIREDLVDTPTRLRRMDDAQIDRQVVAPWVDLCAYHLDPARGSSFSRAVNRHLAEVVATAPDRLAGLATVPLQDAALAAAELRHAVLELGMVGVQIGTTVMERDLHDPALDEFWRAASELRCMVLVHPHQHGLAGRSHSPHFMGNLIGNPSESTIAIGSLVFGGVLERFPELVVVSVHGGGFVPWQSGRWDHGFEVLPGITGTNLTRPPTEYLSRLYFDTVLHDPQIVRMLIDWAGADRVVLGTDYPFPMGDPRPLDTIAAVAGLDTGDHHAVVRGNVDRLIAGVARAGELPGVLASSPADRRYTSKTEAGSRSSQPWAMPDWCTCSAAEKRGTGMWASAAYAAMTAPSFRARLYEFPELV